MEIIVQPISKIYPIHTYYNPSFLTHIMITSSKEFRLNQC